MSDANRVQFSFFRNILGQDLRNFPVDLNNGQLQVLRNNGQPNLAYEIERIASEELRADRNRPDAISVGATASGDVPSELSFGNSDNWLEDIVLSTFANTAAGNEVAFFDEWVNGDGDAFGVDGEIDLGAIGKAGDGAKYKVGNIVRLTHIDVNGSKIDGPYEITAIVVDVLTVTPLAALNPNELANSPPLVAANYGEPAVGTTSRLTITGIIFDAGQYALTQDGSTVTITVGTGPDLSVALGNARVLKPGMFIKQFGFSTDAVTQPTSIGANVYATLKSVTTTTLTFEQPASIAADETPAGRVELFFGDFLRNPDENNIDPIYAHENLLEQAFLDHSPTSYQVFAGMAVGRTVLSLQPRAIASLVPSFLGLNATVGDTTELGDIYQNRPVGAAAYKAAPTNPVYNTSRNVGRLGLGANNVAGGTKNFVLEATLDINGNLEELPAVGVFGAAGLSAGELAVTGTLNTYFDDLSLYRQVLDDGETSFDSPLRSADGRVWGTSVPRLKLNGNPDVPGKNQRVVLNLSYEGLLDSVLGYSVGFHRIRYAR